MKFCILFLMLIGIIGCATSVDTSGQDPTQLGARQLEVRTLDVSYEIAYQAAMHAFFSIGYSIQHSDRASGVLTGSRLVDIKEEKKRRKFKTAMYALPPFFKIIGFLTPGKESTTFQITMLLKPNDSKQTQIRFKMQVDGEPVWDQLSIDRLWVATQREAMVETGPPPTTPPTTLTTTHTIKKHDN